LTDTLKAAACSWVIPRSTAATIRSRRSIEYARMPPAVPIKQSAHRCEALVRPARLTQALRHDLWQTVEDLPQTASGNIREFVLRERYLTSVAG
jgi:acyl-coenzyme A synthetase/AMP-(fatty) acid ligase